MRNKPADIMVREEGGKDVLQVLKQRVICSLWRRPHWSRYFPAANGESHARADIHAASHGGPHIGASGYALKELQHMDSPCWNRFKLKPIERTHAGAGDKCVEEGTAMRSDYGLIAALIPHRPVLFSGRQRSLR